jgi:hypothetical protein
MDLIKIKQIDEVKGEILLNNIDIRSQRLSDTYVVRQKIYDQTNNILTRFYKRFVSWYVLTPIINFFFPMILNNSILVKILSFRDSTQVKVKFFNKISYCANILV